MDRSGHPTAQTLINVISVRLHSPRGYCACHYPRFTNSNLAENDGLRVIKFCSMTSFRGEVKPAGPCCKILWHVKDPYSMKEILVGKINGHFLPSDDESGIIRNQMGKHNRSVNGHSEWATLCNIIL
jgi:hypothetical protein